MPYQKDKQQAFQAAQQGTEEVMDLAQAIDVKSGDYGVQLNHLKSEINEAYGQITNALEVASETQKDQLAKFQQDIQSIVDQVNQD
ncbi:hypothetical protein FZW96_08665 [Bacillus sp. BGMRC 2118]|nr:hypothetical protein FZW96_08665 [Bacillus sp. BGMRC 2118]